MRTIWHCLAFGHGQLLAWSGKHQTRPERAWATVGQACPTSHFWTWKTLGEEKSTLKESWCPMDTPLPGQLTHPLVHGSLLLLLSPHPLKCFHVIAWLRSPPCPLLSLEPHNHHWHCTRFTDSLESSVGRYNQPITCSLHLDLPWMMAKVQERL
jgi:hypothetical protein